MRSAGGGGVAIGEPKTTVTAHGRAIPYQGNYSEYLIQRSKRMATQEQMQQRLELIRGLTALVCSLTTVATATSAASSERRAG